ncbi:PEPxxWA-CTERM sorting domain-containing protein [uncultured Sphingomonas sp.]|uniref:PEPxxWA-CTERM sorting domain-containing protein n=1 Tax=uncultured Sphingomonas sp. TaxID=158754 RepID=UPI00261BBAB0|nr:PEPxxWA-CTERM sorting domain-containing protein [uncultured Sphingomonas sp.]
MDWRERIWRGSLIAVALLSSSPVLARVVYLEQVSQGQSAPAEITGADARIESAGVWGGMEDAARAAAERTGWASRVQTPLANNAIFAQALASRFDLPNEVSLDRLLDFRVSPGAEGRQAERKGERSFVALFLGSDVPEPATWLCLLSGFGMIGAMLRRRRARLVVLASSGGR